MTVSFGSPAIPSDIETGEGYLNVSNCNARDLLRWLGLPTDERDDLFGEAPAKELAARCRRRLWDVERNHDPELPGHDSGEDRLLVVEPDGYQRVVRGEPGPRIIQCGRRPGYLRSKTEQLLKLAEQAGDGVITWG